jgi:hypothetical protein
MKKILTVLVLGLFLSTVVGCGGSPTTPTGGSVSTGTGPRK